MDRSSGKSQGDDALLAEFLAGRDIQCPTCRYNLRDVLNDHCPECGKQLQLHLNVAQPVTTPFLLLFGLVAAAAVQFAIQIPWSLVFVFGLFDNGLFPGDLIFVVQTIIGFFSLFICGFMIKARRRMLALPMKTQWTLVAIPAVYHLFFLILNIPGMESTFIYFSF